MKSAGVVVKTKYGYRAVWGVYADCAASGASGMRSVVRAMEAWHDSPLGRTEERRYINVDGAPIRYLPNP